VRIWLDLPDDIVAQLAHDGQDLSRAALEALAIDAYRKSELGSSRLTWVGDARSHRRK
jgi:cation transport regulator ChaB